MLHETDAAVEKGTDDVQNVLEAANQKMADELKEETDALLSKVLFLASMGMKNSFSKDDM